MKKLFFSGIVILLIIAGVFLIKPSSAVPVGAPRPTPLPAKAQIRTVELMVENRKLVSGPEKISVTQGDTVIIKITADEDEELHLHGYDNSVDLEKNKQAALEFVADKSGHFAYELEKSGTEIGALEVQPK